jgi:hypothetical protein
MGLVSNRKYHRVIEQPDIPEAFIIKSPSVTKRKIEEISLPAEPGNNHLPQPEQERLQVTPPQTVIIIDL